MSEHAVSQRETNAAGRPLNAAALVSSFFATAFLSAIAPRFTIVLLCLLGLLIIVRAVRDGQGLSTLFDWRGALAVFIAVVIYLCINACWSLDPLLAFNKVAAFAIFTLLSFTSVRAMRHWPARRLKAVAKGFAAGAFVAAIYLVVELTTAQVLARSLFNLAPWTRPDGGLSLVHGHVVSIEPFALNRSIAVLTLCFWPALLCLLTAIQPKWRLWIAAAFCVLSILAIGLSVHQTSQIAITVSAIAFLVAWQWPRLGSLTVLAGWLLAFLLVIPLAIGAFKADLYQAKWLPESGQARIILWAYTAEHVRNAPVLGQGIKSTYVRDHSKAARQTARAARPKGYVYNWWAGPHAHNEFLQSWYELGVVGVVLLMAAGAAVLRGISLLPQASKPFLLAHFAAFAGISATGWGMWQVWLMALYGLAACFGGLAAFAAKRAEDKDSSESSA